MPLLITSSLHTILYSMLYERLAIRTIIKLSLIVALSAMDIYMITAEYQAWALGWLYFGAILVLFITSQSCIAPIASDIKTAKYNSEQARTTSIIIVIALLISIDQSQLIQPNPSQHTPTQSPDPRNHEISNIISYLLDEHSILITGLAATLILGLISVLLLLYPTTKHSDQYKDQLRISSTLSISQASQNTLIKLH